ncbi:aminoacetone oxidase family FAD-binding enzyme [Eubacterium sp. 1001713B170207_170306_E7]|uniref:NAD(P)/FAD-dependent oxidoreductase n=1 Tax=Eubacterium sp. 1001713B170207_170306_E7 TaxID=2787097 RepID=UPI0018985740|nr:aminoacetone oxidase family FAD-binding enzyme [Eubacterium sp. 1001713B170207_170306_E7]
MENYTDDLIIIGAGAAGLAAAVTAKRAAPSLRVTVLEKKEAPGKKLRATGNGRCNITNTALDTAPSTIAFFESLGIPARQDDEGRVYPFSESAPGVAEVFASQLKALGVHLRMSTPVKRLSADDGCFVVMGEKKPFRAKAVILATGGKAGPAYGCSGDGYAMAKALGHHVTKTLPVLTGICCEEMPEALKGIRVKGNLSLACHGETVFSEYGEVQFTDYGLSGICVFNLSRYLKYLGDEKLTPYTIAVDLAPKRSFAPMLSAWQQDAVLGEKSCLAAVTGIVRPPLAALLLKQAGLQEEKKLSALTAHEISRLDEQFHRLCFKPVSTMGFKMAQCTAGGIADNEVDEDTLASKIVPGLYFAGEILDYDGPCGGYNLDHAFRTGQRAAQAAAAAVLQGEQHV